MRLTTGLDLNRAVSLGSEKRLPRVLRKPVFGHLVCDTYTWLDPNNMERCGRVIRDAKTVHGTIRDPTIAETIVREVADNREARTQGDSMGHAL